MPARTEERARWLSWLHSTEPADRPRAEAALRVLYAAAGFPEPAHVLWYDSPCAASWALAAMVPNGDRTSSQLLAPRALRAEQRDRLERARTELRERLGVATWDEVVETVGPSRLGVMMIGLDPRRTLAPALLQARFSLVDEMSAFINVRREDDDLSRAESHYWGSQRGVLCSPSACPTTDFLLRRSFYDQHPLSSLADDVLRAGTREVPPILDAVATVARTAGLWWPYERAVVVSDRPSQIHCNDAHLPHRDDGPALVFRDGWQVFAWNGKAVPERWIMRTESVAPGEYRGFDPSFFAWARAKRKPATSTKKRARPSSILTVALPKEHGARLEFIRTHAGGALPRFDRYLAGAHPEVWTELVALGAAVREEAHAADALAVAYETMHRVAANVRVLIERLAAMDYVFAAPDSPHVPPDPHAQTDVAAFEKRFGAMPLSLRAFYEVVGAVDLIGRHPAIDSPDHAITTDPLVVYGLDEALLEYDDEEAEDGSPIAITIAPDDLHKANVSGGSPYTIDLPNAGADGALVGERHGLLFVDYLRLCCAFAGFPGCDGRDTPREIRALAADLAAF